MFFSIVIKPQFVVLFLSVVVVIFQLCQSVMSCILEFNSSWCYNGAPSGVILKKMGTGAVHFFLFFQHCEAMFNIFSA